MDEKLKYSKDKFRIVLIRNGERLPQTGLHFRSRTHAQETADYLNSLLPDNLDEIYVAERIVEEE